MAGKVFVYSNKVSLMEDILAGAASLGDVSAVVIGDDGQMMEAVKGVHNIYQIKLPDGCMPEAATETLAELVKKESPDILIIGATLTGRAIAGRLAAKLNTTVFADAKALALKEDGIEAVNMVYGGGANLTQKAKGGITMALLGFGTLEKTERQEGACTVVEVPFVTPPWSIQVTETREREAVSVNLSAAKRIVSLGLGVGEKEDIKLVEALAKAFGAEVGCSRPIAEGLEWMPKECYVGISGVFTKAELYMAVGISGQVQHMVGVKDAKTVVAINKDANAPIMKQCDYGLVGNLYDIIPALLEKLER